MAQELQTPRLQGIARHDQSVAIRLAWEQARARQVNTPPHAGDPAYQSYRQATGELPNPAASRADRDAFIRQRIHEAVSHPDLDAQERNGW
jgi:hypothetical protein